MPGNQPVDQPPLDLGVALRALRRRRDLSQRQLAELAGVPASTLARIESGEITNPRIRTVERLARVAGAAVWVGAQPHQPVPPIPHERRTDAADRHYPAHLDVHLAYPFTGRDRRVLPAGTAVNTFDLDRGTRDATRARAAAVADLSIARFCRPGGDGWLWVARTDAGEVAGRLGAVLLPDPVLCGFAVAPQWRGYPLEQRLLGYLREELARRRPTELVTLTQPGPRVEKLKQLGFAHRPTRVMLLAARP